MTTEDARWLAGYLHRMVSTRPATCALVNRLVRAGLVERRPDPDDLRRVVVAVTHQSAQMIGKVDPETARRLQAVLTNMGAAAQRILTEVLKDTA